MTVGDQGCYQDPSHHDDLGSSAEMIRGVRLAIDVGSVRVGVAASDPDGLIATPVETLQRAKGASKSTVQHGTISERGQGDRWPDDIARIATEVVERSAQVVYVGLPRQLSGVEGAASLAAREYALEVAGAIAPVPVRMVDERMTTVTAHQALHAAGRPGRQHRAVVDQVAAVVILQSALDTERAWGRRAGEAIHLSDLDDQPGATK